MEERRGTRRFALKLPVEVRLVGSEGQVQTQTKDVSARGVYFFLDAAIEEGAQIDFTLTLPPEITLTDSIHVKCRGRAIRVEPEAQGGKTGVAAVIEEYQFLS
jgi:PilZ domain